MQSKLFVFVGLPIENPETELQVLMETLNKKFTDQNIPITFSQKAALLTGRIYETAFHITFIKTKNEIRDYYEMADNFNMSFDRKAVSSKELAKRYSLLEASSRNLYQPIHYAIGLAIINEIEKLSGISIYAFQ